MKIKLLNPKEKRNALNEVRFLASITHNNIIAYKEAFIEQGNLCIIMEYADGQDALKYIKSRRTPIPEAQIWSIFTQALQGLKTLHDLGIVHRDLKTENIFLMKDRTVKIGDLNVSTVTKTGMAYTQIGTPYYASPEIWKDLPYDSKSDIWSLGCVLYELLTLHPPFEA